MKKAGKPTRNGAVRVRSHRSDFSPGRKPAIAEKICEKVGCERRGSCPITQVRRTVLLAEKPAIVYLQRRALSNLQWAWQPNVADFMVKSAHFVFKDNVRRSSRRSAFFAPYTVIRPAQVGTAQAGTPLKNCVFYLCFSFLSLWTAFAHAVRERKVNTVLT